jgi:hypothetical protein
VPGSGDSLNILHAAAQEPGHRYFNTTAAAINSQPTMT